MDNKPILCLLCDGVMSAVERYEKHLRIDHRVVCRVNWIIENTVNGCAVDIKKDVEDSKNVEDESGENSNVEEVTEFIEEAISNGTLGAYENSEEDNNAYNNLKNDDETLIDKSFDTGDANIDNLMENDIRDMETKVLNEDSKIKMKKKLKIEERIMKKKLENEESKIQKKIKNVNCKLCKKEFKSKLGLTGHLKRKHQREVKDTEFVVGGENKIEFQERVAKNIELVEETFKYIQSKDYVKNESQSEALAINFLLPNSNIGYGCSLCPDKVFRDKDTVKRHLKIHISKDDRDKILCLECNKGFLNSDFLKEHMKQCEGLKEIYFCPEKSCKVSFENSKDFKQHQKTHRLDITSKKQFFCDACGKVFKKSDHLKRHSAGHSDNQYACDFCEKVFKRLDHVKRHAVTHTNTKFSCETCLKTFSRKYRLMEHQKSAHEIKQLNI